MRLLRRASSIAALAAAALLAAPASAAPPRPVPPARPGPSEAEVLCRQALQTHDEKKLDEALALAERAVVAGDKTDPDGRVVLMALKMVADFNIEKGQPARAVAPRERIARIREKSSKESAELLFALEDLGSALHAAGEHARAVAAYERASPIALKRDGGKEGEHVSFLLMLMAKPLQALRRYDETEAVLLRAIAAREEQRYGRAALAHSIIELARLYKVTGAWVRAEALFTRALNEQERAWGEGTTHVIGNMVELGGMRDKLQDHAGARALFEEAALIAVQNLGTKSLTTASTTAILGAHHLATGALDLAEAQLLGAESTCENLPPDPDVATLLRTVRMLRGQLAVQKGDFERGEALLREGLASLEKERGPKHKDLAAPLTELAGMHRKKRQFDRAEAYAVRALDVIDEALPPTNPERAETRATLGRIRELRGDVAGGKKLHEEALAMREKAFGAEHPQVARSLLDLADLARRAGHADEAEGLYKRTIAIVEKNFGPDHEQVAASLEGLASVYGNTGKMDLAVRIAARAADIRERQASLVIAGGSESQKRSFLATLGTGTDFVVSLHARRAAGDLAAKKLALTTVLQRKGRVLDVMADTQSALRKRLSPADQKLFDELARARADVARLAIRGPAGAPLDSFRAELRERAEKARALEEKMGGQDDVFRAQQTPVTIERLQAVLPEGSALVETFVYVPRRAADSEMPTREGAPRHAAYVLHPSGKIDFVDLGESSAIEAAVLRLREALVKPDGAFDSSAARAAHDLVMKPILPLLEGKTRVLLSPDGALSVLPFAALVDEAGKHLVERLEITYLTSGRDLLRLANPAAPRSGMLVVANPAFGQREQGESALALLGEAPAAADAGKGPSRGLEKAYFEPLPGTASEARAIGARIAGASVRVDLEATESALKAARAPKMLHVATHGFFLPAHSRGQQAALAGERGLELEYDEPWSWLPDDPLLRSGLALAGANAKKGGGGEDGILTALEASSLDLRGTKLVVLSACETGLGDVRNGEGVYGLRRALFVAGAETLVTSFWKVADEETRELMVGYYERLGRGAGRSAALREAQLAMLGQERTAHPYFWASFGVFGDPAPLGEDPKDAQAPKARPAKPGTLTPGARGCACTEARGDATGAAEGAGLLTALGALVGLGSRRRRRARGLA